jgi:hypothetical protein
MTMNRPELAAFVALIADDAERRFGTDDNAALRDAYARDAALDLWMTQPGVTVATANGLLRQVRDELRRRWIQRQERNDQRRIDVENLLAEIVLPAGHCPRRLQASAGNVAMQPTTQSFHRGVERTERRGALAAR